jgi:hypothetical protein
VPAPVRWARPGEGALQILGWVAVQCSAVKGAACSELALEVTEGGVCSVPGGDVQCSAVQCRTPPMIGRWGDYYCTESQKAGLAGHCYRLHFNAYCP